MSNTLATSLRIQLSAAIQSAGEDLGNALAQIAANLSATLANGTTNAQADLVHAKTYSTATNTTIDMGTAGGTLNPLGGVFEPAEICLIYFATPSANPANMTIGAAGAEPFVWGLGGTAPTTTLKPGAAQLFYDPAGWAVVNNVNDKVKLTSSSGTNAVAVVIIGRSA